MLEWKIHTQECQEEWGSKSLIFQGAIATTLTQPLDVCKTRAMNAKPGEFKGLNHHSSATVRFPGCVIPPLCMQEGVHATMESNFCHTLYRTRILTIQYSFSRRIRLDPLHRPPRPAGILQGLRAGLCPSRPAHRPHIHLPRAAQEKLWTCERGGVLELTKVGDAGALSPQGAAATRT